MPGKTQFTRQLHETLLHSTLMHCKQKQYSTHKTITVQCKMSWMVFGPIYKGPFPKILSTCSICNSIGSKQEKQQPWSVLPLEYFCCWSGLLLPGGSSSCLSAPVSVGNTYRTTSRTKNWHLTPLRMGHSTPPIWSFAISVLFLFPLLALIGALVATYMHYERSSSSTHFLIILLSPCHKATIVVQNCNCVINTTQGNSHNAHNSPNK